MEKHLLTVQPFPGLLLMLCLYFQLFLFVCWIVQWILNVDRVSYGLYKHGCSLMLLLILFVTYIRILLLIFAVGLIHLVWPLASLIWHLCHLYYYIITCAIGPIVIQRTSYCGYYLLNCNLQEVHTSIILRLYFNYTSIIQHLLQICDFIVVLMFDLAFTVLSAQIFLGH